MLPVVFADIDFHLKFMMTKFNFDCIMDFRGFRFDVVDYAF
jgi:hypothetical protein